MGTISTTAINPSDQINAEPLDNNFNAIKNEFNGNIENVNIKASAAISWSKISKSASTIDDIADVAITAAATGDALGYNGTNWVNAKALLTTAKAGVYANTNQSIPNSTYTKVVFQIEEYDPGSNFDNVTNNRYTVAAGFGGKYLINGQIDTGVAMGAGKVLVAAIYKNGVRIKETANLQGPSAAVMAILDLVATDYIELFALHDNGAAMNLTGAQDSTFLYVHLLSN